ncbi:uncharacterized protein LOC134717350 [Mytilus trossulus]|uniref:uncharacterized protein LOC134717350 n=1 Tax=Mytilus trossulus TaxID=6551 RepID=UPI003003EB87
MYVRVLTLLLLVSVVLEYSLARKKDRKKEKDAHKVRGKPSSIESSPIILQMEEQIKKLEEQIAKIPKNSVHIHMSDGNDDDESSTRLALDSEDHHNTSVHRVEGAIELDGDDDHHHHDHDKARVETHGNEQHIHMHMHLESSDCKHKKHDDEVHAHCEVFPNSNVADGDDIRGAIHLIQKGDDPVEIFIALNGFDMTKENPKHSHGFHVHQYGDTSNSCDSLGGHFNPSGSSHGAQDAHTRHVGDLGNIDCDMNGEIDYKMKDETISLHAENSLIGRSIVIHEGPDDLGMGGDAGSLKGGNAGPKVACCVIVLADPTKHQHHINIDAQEGGAKHEGHTGLDVHEVKP